MSPQNPQKISVPAVVFCLLCAMSQTGIAAEPIPEKVARWLKPQDWQRDVDGPIVSLGSEGEFDDKHIFAPCVAMENGQYQLWYCGSQGAVASRVFQMGLTTSTDGRIFQKIANNPVFAFGDGKHSVLTPTLLRSANGAVLREGGKLRMWFAATDFVSGDGAHTLHESSSENGIQWSSPSAAQLKNIYAPTILKEGDIYRMWFTDVAHEPWSFRYATSADGKTWDVRPDPIMQVEQKWERGRLFYPTVVKADDVFLMWYGSYQSAQPSKTAIGFAASSDGVHWHKNPHNPVLRPDESRPWESHYTTSQSVMRLPDGSWRIWYASRKKPPFVNKYFAIGTARWSGPEDTK